MNVLVDSKEKGRIKPALFFFSENNNVSVKDMLYGDYVFVNDENDDECAFEYKTCSDFITSVMENRVFNQAVNQAEHFKYHFVIIEYTDDLRASLSKELWYRQKVHFTKSQFYGAIARLNTYTTVLSAHNQRTCFELMEKQARKCFDDKTVQKQLRKVSSNSAMNYLVNCCEGVGEVTAENITGDLKLFTLEDLLGLDKELLLSVNGVGSVTADRILKSLRKDSS